ncbi:hypothetical protein HZA44_04015, partial [Candidatus Peregrinibacteria bacterium]|nr:hypothetical protein [Candidatus Peregrinibacteria bacterium]
MVLGVLPSSPALAVNEVCPAGMTAATTCCVPPPSLAAGCPAGKVWIGSASGGGCRTPVSCPAQQFSCSTNACVATSSGTAVCPGQLHIGNNVCVDTLTVIRQALTDTVYKVWRGSVLGRLVTVPDSDCVDGQTPVWNNTTKAWACGQGDSLWLASGNDISNTNTGNVGIGTVSSPVTKLTVTASGAKTDHFFGAAIGNTSTSSTPAKLKMGLGVSSTGTWDGAGSINYGLSVNATGGTVNYAAIFNGGYVGIGTSTPQTGLHIKKDGWPGSFLMLDTNAINQDAGIRLNENAVTKWHIYNKGATGDNLSIENASGPVMTVDQTGRVGVSNTNPRSALDIGNSGALSLTASAELPGSIIFENSSGGAKAAIATTPTVGEGGLRFIGKGGNIDMMTADNGAVGVGTTAPASQLDVSRDNSAYPSISSFGQLFLTGKTNHNKTL